MRYIAKAPATSTCPHCGRNVVTRKDGTRWRHRVDIGRDNALCEGSGETVWEIPDWVKRYR